MNHPLRIQRRRTKGYRLPDGAICVGRPSRWGNPFGSGALYSSLNKLQLEYDFSSTSSPVRGRLGCETVFFMGTPLLESEIAVLLFRHWIAHWSKKWPEDYRLYIEPLRGHQLACWCDLSMPCHADVLCELANGDYADVCNS